MNYTKCDEPECAACALVGLFESMLKDGMDPGDLADMVVHCLAAAGAGEIDVTIETEKWLH